MITNTCVVCGKSFQTVHPSMCCTDCKTRECIICGKEFELKHPYTAVTCSRKCTGEYRKQTGVAKASAEKAKKTLEERYGVSNSSELQKFKKICKWCGKEFETTSARQEYCGDDYGPCPVCGKQVKIRDMSKGPQACSKECRQKLIEQTSLERYGDTVAANSKHGREKAKHSNQKKYGVDHYSKTSEYKAKFTKTMNERYSVDHALQNDEIKQKWYETNQERYGADTPLENEEVRAKARATQEANGGIGLSREGAVEHFKEVSRSKYGTDFPTQSEEVKSKIFQTNLNRYGATCWLATEARLKITMMDPSKMKEFEKFRVDVREYIENLSYKPSYSDLSDLTGITPDAIGNYVVTHKCQDLIDYHKSSIEQQIHDFIKSIDCSIEIKRNDRTVIKPMEIDLYLPDFKLGIECNPTYTHNSSKSTHWSNCIVPNDYHAKKSMAAEKAGIFLLHVFGYEWTFRRDVVKSIIRNLLGANTHKYMARKLSIKSVPDSDAIEFLNANHIQGYTASSIRIGLYSSDSLISVMSFSKPRPTLGKTDDSDSASYELTRFCTLRDTTCIGGASKLFKHFVNSYRPSKVVSFSSIASTRGSVYQLLGFKPDGHVSPGYVWVDLHSDIYHSRVACQKRFLPKLLNEPDLDIDNQTEDEIMESHGFVKVYNSGLVRWVYR